MAGEMMTAGGGSGRGGLIPLVVAGAAGRMGRRVVALAMEELPRRFELVGAIDRAGCAAIGHDAGVVAGVGEAGVRIVAALADDLAGGGAAEGRGGGGGVVVDFSAAAATRGLIAECGRRGIAMVIGTTGLTTEDQTLIDEAARRIPILQAANMSLGVNVLLGLVAAAARQLGEGYDIEIVEAHHNQKKDAPSGTALSLAQAIAKAMGRGGAMERDLVHGREGKEALRRAGTIGVHAVRMGDVVGEHTVYFAGAGERVEIRHVATSRDTFAKGALRAAAFLAMPGRKAGRYTMGDVLRL